MIFAPFFGKPINRQNPFFSKISKKLKLVHNRSHNLKAFEFMTLSPQNLVLLKNRYRLNRLQGIQWPHSFFVKSFIFRDNRILNCKETFIDNFMSLHDQLFHRNFILKILNDFYYGWIRFGRFLVTLSR